MTKAVKMTIVVPEPERFDGRCPPAKLIRRLTRQRRLPSFAQAFGDWTDDAGNCVSVSTALLIDLQRQGFDEGWEIVLDNGGRPPRARLPTVSIAGSKRTAGPLIAVTAGSMWFQSPTMSRTKVLSPTRG
jgi:hypothetical protein